ncbi:hypothetical protein [Microvirga tunisiensis]|uniref:Uncharacterized protein n=1 Tax=Microvirga tunisiensis TaxID=2108360 RepID=A0A5N7MWC9_9HYPH|nr:hypothetical protein [Microvirga tunisiensis]MPR10150.1 hypothetical protein [Microvirga tunisiensis]MPR28356.1 hypothetical protein [Microvirga tunisiensis]
MSVIDTWRMRCPHCRKDSKIEIVAKVSVRLTADGTDSDEVSDGSHEWDDDSQADCRDCGFSGLVKDFRMTGLDLVDHVAEGSWILESQVRVLSEEPTDRQHLRIVDGNGTTVALALLNPDAEDSHFNARIVAASAGILEDVVDLKQFVTDTSMKMDDPHRDGSGRDARPPDGDDWNILYQKVLSVISAIEQRIAA